MFTFFFVFAVSGNYATVENATFRNTITKVFKKYSVWLIMKKNLVQFFRVIV